MSGVPHVPPLPIEEVPAGEAAAIDALISELKRQIRERYKGTEARRDAHPKTLGMVHASFTIDEACPPELRYGLFDTPGRSFDAQIRYSNGYPVVRHDLLSDIRGMAIKLSQVPSKSFLGDHHQDFVLGTGEAFFGSDAVDYQEFPKIAEHGLKVLWYFVQDLRLRGLQQLFNGQKLPPSPLALDYFSQTPYRLGPHCVKYQVRPSACRWPTHDPIYLWPVVRKVYGLILWVLSWFDAKLKWMPWFDALRTSLARDVARTPVDLDFLVQRWPDMAGMPVWAIEDATRTWPGPWVRVATIRIKEQKDIASNDAKAERMSFTPWRTCDLHRPLGSINRARLRIYTEMAAFRNELNDHRPDRPQDPDSLRSESMN